MEKIHAYIDESGAFGFDFSKTGTSTHFIITAITIKEQDVDSVREQAEILRKKFFGTGEIKSSKVKSNHNRRLKILEDVKKLPIHAFVLVIDKRQIYDYSGIRYKKTFYKFLNQILYNELQIYFNKLHIEVDAVGENDFQKEFYAYARRRMHPMNLFDEREFNITDSKNSVLVQLADIISGSLSYFYEESKRPDNIDYLKILQPIILQVKEFPKSYERTLEDEATRDPKFNKQIFEIAYRAAEHFIQSEFKNADETLVKEQKCVLNYLLFRFLNNSSRKYISTQELINALEYSGFKSYNVTTFRANIIAKLRDAGVVISSSKQGYKLPTSLEELCDYISHTKNVILPMISRLKRCNEVIKSGSNGEIDLFHLTQYKELHDLLEPD